MVITTLDLIKELISRSRNPKAQTYPESIRETWAKADKRVEGMVLRDDMPPEIVQDLLLIMSDAFRHAVSKSIQKSNPHIAELVDVFAEMMESKISPPGKSSEVEHVAFKAPMDVEH